MEKFTILIDLPLNTIQKAYRQHLGGDRKPTKKDIGIWIGNLAEADIISIAGYDDEDEDEE